MIRDDYLLRTIRRFMQALLRIREARDEGRLDDAEANGEQALRSLCGLDARSAVAVSRADLLAMLPEDEPDRVAAVGEVLAELAEVHAARGQASRVGPLRAQALGMLLSVEDGSTEAVRRLVTLARGVEASTLPAAVREDLHRLYRRLGWDDLVVD